MAVSNDALLVAGPVGTDAEGLLTGAGFCAAAAAAPLTFTQLWARADLNETLQALLTRRRIDCAGLDADGAADAFLPESEPVSAERLGAVLLADLPEAEHQRACALMDRLGGKVLRIVVRSDGDPMPFAGNADLLITPADRSAPHAQAQALLAAGATSVLLTAGELGGLMAYKQKSATWPALPTTSRCPELATTAIFAGVVAAATVAHGKLDYRGLRRAVTTAGAVTAAALKGPGPKALMGLDRAAYQQAYLRLRRGAKV